MKTYNVGNEASQTDRGSDDEQEHGSIGTNVRRAERLLPNRGMGNDIMAGLKNIFGGEICQPHLVDAFYIEN